MKNRPDNLTPKEVRRGLALSLTGSTLGMIWVAVALTMPMALYLETLGAGGVAIGLLTMLPQIAMIVQIPSTFFIERLSRRKGICISTALISRAVYFLPALIFFLPESMRSKAIPILLITAGINAFIGQVSVIPWLSWMADLVPDKQRGAYWGKRQAITTVSFLAALAFSGWMLDRFPEGSLGGFALLFFIATILECRIFAPNNEWNIESCGNRQRDIKQRHVHRNCGRTIFLERAQNELAFDSRTDLIVDVIHAQLNKTVQIVASKLGTTRGLPRHSKGI